MRPHFTWRLRSRALELGPRTLIMGVVNVTPDSFSDGGLYLDCDRAVQHALRLLDEGADLLDIGGESTRPGARVADQAAGAGAPSSREAKGGTAAEIAQDAAGTRATEIGLATGVDLEEELRRVLPVIGGVLRARPQTIISVDTYKSEVARRAVFAGAEIVNDVSAGSWD